MNDEGAVSAPTTVVLAATIKAFRESVEGAAALKKTLEVGKVDIVKCVKLSRSSSSVCNSSGVRVVDTKKDIYFRCLLGDCVRKGTMIKLTKSSTSKASNHLKDIHSIISSKTNSLNANMASLSKLLNASGDSFRSNPKRWFEVRSIQQAEHIN